MNLASRFARREAKVVLERRRETRLMTVADRVGDLPNGETACSQQLKRVAHPAQTSLHPSHFH
jgi:hypothetical protein